MAPSNRIYLYHKPQSWLGRVACDAQRILGGLVLYLLCMASGADQSGDGLDMLLASIDELRREFDIAAVGFSLVDADRILWSGAWGIADRASNQPVQPNTMFRIGSVTKSFTALAILRLAQDDSLKLDSRVRELAPHAPFRNRWATTHPVTVEQLLEHTAGMPDISKLEFDNADPKPLTLSEGLALHPQSRVSRWPPGLHSEYSNSGAGLAGYVIEQISGAAYEDFMENQIFAPLGMYDTSLLKDPETARRLATGYDTDGHTVIPYWHMVMRPFGAINTTANDMAAFVQMLLNLGQVQGKRIFNKQSIERMENVNSTLAARNGLRYGYALGNYQWLRDGFLFHGHGGDADGYLAHYGYNREAQRGYFVVITAFNKRALRRIREQIERYITAGLEAPTAVTTRLENEQLIRLSGSYEIVTERFPGRKPAGHRLTVTAEGGRLYTNTAAGQRRALLPVTPWHFRREDEPIATTAFVVHDGALFLQGKMGNYRRID